MVREDPSLSLNLCSNCRRSVSSLQTAAIYTISDFDEKILSIRKIVFLTITFNVNTNATSERSVPHQFIRNASGRRHFVAAAGGVSGTPALLRFDEFVTVCMWPCSAGCHGPMKRMRVVEWGCRFL